MARCGGRGRTITRPTNQIAAVIFGLRQDAGDIVRISAYEKRDDVILHGPGRPHPVHLSNVRSIEGWCREAGLHWYLTDVYHVTPGFEHSEHERELYAELKTKSAKRKRELAEQPR